MLDSWFQKPEKFLKDINLLSAPDLSSRLWNADETGFCTSMASQKVLARRGSREVHETSGGSDRDYYTVLGAGAADGTRLPPFILYKGCNLYLRWTSGGPAGAVYGVSDSGWMEANNFCQWFEKLYIPAVASLLSTGLVVLFVDGHHSHLTDKGREEQGSSPILPATPRHAHCATSGCWGVWSSEEGVEGYLKLETLGETVTKEELNR